MEIDQHLEKAEKSWLKASFDFLKIKFEQNPLPSHDHNHHMRVWNHARKLLSELERQGNLISYEFVESLLLSCMFHDSGMIVEKGSKHGKESVVIFKEFLQNSPAEPSNLKDITQAIENHDNKEYTLAGKLVVDGEVMLLPALNVSDDLDALGNIGIYRYSEIYLLRGIPFEDLGLKIIANLSGRYGNFIANCSRLPEMIMVHSIRHHTIESFFRMYNLQIRKMDETGQPQDTGPIKVVKHIYKEVMRNTPDIPAICQNVLKATEDQYVKNYFQILESEVNQNL